MTDVWGKSPPIESIDITTSAALAAALLDSTLPTAGDALVMTKYETPASAAVLLHDYIEDSGAYNVLGFVAQNLKAAIRNYTTVTDVHVAVQAAIDAAIADGHAVFFPRGRYVAPGLTVTNYLGKGLSIDGAGALIRLGANETAFTVTGSERVRLGRGIHIDSTLVSGANQVGVSLANSGLIEVFCDIETLTTGVKSLSGRLGVQNSYLPNTWSPRISACLVGLWTDGTAEYVDIINAEVLGCTQQGIYVASGNCSILGGRIVGNVINVEITGLQSANADHGKIVGATINHGLSANLYIHDLVYSMIVSNNNLWAAFLNNFGAGPLATSFGAYLKNVKNLNMQGNVFGHNKTQIGIDGLTSSLICNNTFRAVNTTTVTNWLEITPITPANGNRLSPNTYEGSLVAAANNGDYEQTYVIGTAGAPAFQNAWVNFGSGSINACYRKDAAGFVHLAGTVQNGSGIPTTIFTLPAGFRPEGTVIQIVLSNGAVGRVNVSAAGVVSAELGSTAWFSLDSVSFKAAA